MSIFVIPGHGAGDPGACGNGYSEAERVRALAQRIKDFGGESVELADFDRNYYEDGGINYMWFDENTKVIELHMDAATPSARGGHVIICDQFEPDEYDIALEQLIVGMFPGRSITISRRGDLANPNRAANRGVNYRLVELGFITNAQDVATFNARMDELAQGIVDAMGGSVYTKDVAPSPAPEWTPSAPVPVLDIDDLARRVINGEFGNGEERKARLFPNYDAVQTRVNEMLGCSVSHVSGDPAEDIEGLAWRVINGEFGNGQERKDRLGDRYAAVQKRVNQLLGY